MALHVLIVLHGMPPLPGRPAVGSGIRAFCNGEGLRARGHRVEYATRAEDLPPPPVEGGPPRGLEAVQDDARHADLAPMLAPPGGDPGAPGNPLTFTTTEDLAGLVRACAPDVILVEQFEEARRLEGMDVPVVLDLFAPRVLEAQFQGPQADQEIIRTLDALDRGDWFAFSNERQKLFYLSLLALAGVDCTHAPVGVVPVAGSPLLPAVHKPEHPVFICGGVFWPWADLRPGLTVLQDHLERRRRGRVEVFGGAYTIRSEAVDYADPRTSLPASPRVRYRGIVAIDDLLDSYRRASVAFDVMEHNTEREMNLSFRQVDYLRCGLPIITSSFQEIAADLKREGAGWVVEPGDEMGLRRVVDHVLDHPEEVARASEAAQRLARDRYSWLTSVEPLDTFVRSAARRTRRPSVLAAMSRVTTELWAEHEEVPRLRDALAVERHVNSKKSDEVTDLNRQVWKLIDSVDRMSLSVEEVTRFKSDAIRYLGEEEDRALKSAGEAAREVERLKLDLLKKSDALRVALDDLERVKEGIGSLQGELERSRDLVFNRDRQLGEMRAERERLQAALTESREEARDLAVDRAKKTEELAGLVERFSQARGHAEAQMAELEGRFLARLDSAEDRARTVLDGLRARLDAALEDRDQARARAEALEQQSASLARDTEKKSRELDAAQAAFQGERARFGAEIQAAHDLFASRLDAAEVASRSVVETLRHRVLATEAERDGLRVRVEGLERGVQQLKGELNRRAAELKAERQERLREQRDQEGVRARLEATALSRIDQAEGEARALTEGLHDQVSRLQTERDELRRLALQHQQVVPDLRRDLRKKSVEIQELVRDKERLRREAQQASLVQEGHFAGLLQAAESKAETVFTELRLRLQAAVDEGKTARDQLSRTEEVVQELKRELQKRYAEARDTRAQARDDRRRSTEENAQVLREAAHTAEATIASIQERMESVKDESSQFRLERDALVARLARAEAELPPLRRDLVKKNDEIRELAAVLRQERADRERALTELAGRAHQDLTAAQERAADVLAQADRQRQLAASRAGALDEELARHRDVARALRADVAKKNDEIRALQGAVRTAGEETRRAASLQEEDFIARLALAHAEATGLLERALEGHSAAASVQDAVAAERDRYREQVQVLKADVRKKSTELAQAAALQRALAHELEQFRLAAGTSVQDEGGV